MRAPATMRGVALIRPCMPSQGDEEGRCGAIRQTGTTAASIRRRSSLMREERRGGPPRERAWCITYDFPRLGLDHAGRVRKASNGGAPEPDVTGTASRRTPPHFRSAGSRVVPSGEWPWRTKRNRTAMLWPARRAASAGPGTNRKSISSSGSGGAQRPCRGQGRQQLPSSPARPRRGSTWLRRRRRRRRRDAQAGPVAVADASGVASSASGPCVAHGPRATEEAGRL
jgi:hypothetical protein